MDLQHELTRLPRNNRSYVGCDTDRERAGGFVKAAGCAPSTFAKANTRNLVVVKQDKSDTPLKSFSPAPNQSSSVKAANRVATF